MKKEISLYIWVVAITILTSIITTFATYNVITTYLQKNTQFTGVKLSPADDTQDPWGDNDGDGVPNTYDNCDATPGPSCNLGCPGGCTGVIVFPTQPPATTAPTVITTTLPTTIVATSIPIQTTIPTQTAVPTVVSTNPTIIVNPTQKPVTNTTPRDQPTSAPTTTQVPNNGIIAALTLTANFENGKKYSTAKEKETITGTVSTGGITLTIKVNAVEKSFELGGSQQFTEEIALTEGPNVVTVTAFDPGTKQREEITFTMERTSTTQTTSSFKMDIGTGILIVTIITFLFVIIAWAFMHYSKQKISQNNP